MKDKFYKVLERTYIWGEEGKSGKLGDTIIPRVFVLVLSSSVGGSLLGYLEKNELVGKEVQIKSLYPMNICLYQPSERGKDHTRGFTYVFKEITEGEYLVLDIHLSTLDKHITELEELIKRTE